MKNNKMGFFKRIWYAIDKIDKYAELAADGFSKAFKYLITLVIILSIILSVGAVYKIGKQIYEISGYIKENAPEFNYKDKILSIDMQEPIINKDEKYGKIIIDTSTQTKEEDDQYINSVSEQENGVIILKDRLVLKEAGKTNSTTYNYGELFEALKINEFDKNLLVEYMQGSTMLPVYFQVCLVLFIQFFVIQLINIILYIIIISMFGLLTSMILRLKLKYIAILNMTIYSITLSMLLHMIYVIVNSIFDYRIAYFEVMYMLVATIYMIAALFIIKAESNKKQQEVQKVIEVEKEVKEELKKEEEKQGEEKQKKEEEKEDKNNGEEPEGSNA